MIANRYWIDTEIQRGAFGVIYKGLYEKKREQVAIKIDHSDKVSLKHEVRIIQYLYQAGVKKIPQIYWFGLYENKPCVVITLYECSLYDYYKKGISTENIHKIMWLLLDIFENIHKNWVIHRDIKPHNFMIKSGEIFLIDFGLATFFMNENGEHCPNTGTDTMIGSPYFSSLRIHQGNRYSRRDDLISLGYVYLYMQGIHWKITEMEDQGSQLDLSHPMNILIQNEKDKLEDYLLTDKIRIYMKYVYELLYDDTPKYSALKLLFIS